MLAGLGLGAAGLSGAAPAAAPIAPDDPRLKTATVRQTVSPGRTLTLYLAVPAKARGRRPAVLVAHDDAGLDERAREAARQIALLGYVACAPDFLSRLSGTPADAVAARIMVNKLDPAETLRDATATLQWLGRNPAGERVLTGRVGAVGIGWGAALVTRLAGASDQSLGAAIVVGRSRPAPPFVGGAPLLRFASADEIDWRSAGAFLKEHLR